MVAPRLVSLDDHDAAFVSASEFAVYLGVERRQVVKWIHAGALPAYRFDERTWRVRVIDAVAFIERNRFQPPSAARISDRDRH